MFLLDEGHVFTLGTVFVYSAVMLGIWFYLYERQPEISLKGIDGEKRFGKKEYMILIAFGYALTLIFINFLNWFLLLTYSIFSVPSSEIYLIGVLLYLALSFFYYTSEWECYGKELPFNDRVYILLDLSMNYLGILLLLIYGVQILIQLLGF